MMTSVAALEDVAAAVAPVPAHNSPVVLSDEEIASVGGGGYPSAVLNAVVQLVLAKP